MKTIIFKEYNMNQLILSMDFSDSIPENHEGRVRYWRRKLENEPVFGNLKQNMHFRRFHLRGFKKVHVEFGLLALAHNLIKKVKIDFQQ